MLVHLIKIQYCLIICPNASFWRIWPNKIRKNSTPEMFFVCCAEMQPRENLKAWGDLPLWKLWNVKCSNIVFGCTLNISKYYKVRPKNASWWFSYSLLSFPNRSSYRFSLACYSSAKHEVTSLDEKVAFRDAWREGGGSFSIQKFILQILDLNTGL